MPPRGRSSSYIEIWIEGTKLTNNYTNTGTPNGGWSPFVKLIKTRPKVDV